MRILELKSTGELFGQGYTVVSGDMHYETIDMKKCRPIQMYHVKSHEELSSQVDFLTNIIRFDGEDLAIHNDVCDNFSTILQGRHPEWKLVTFNVHVGCLYLIFYNSKTEERCNEFFYRTSIAGLQFNVQGRNGYEEIYQVSIDYANSRHHYTEVVETIGNVRKEITFHFMYGNKTNPFKDPQYVEITEYAG